MDYMEKITDLRARKKDLKDQAAKLVEEDKLDDATALADQMETINKQIAGLEALAKASREGADPVYDGVLHDGEGKPRDGGKDAPKPFATLGEQLKAISDFRRSHVEDKRLQQVNNAALGANEGTGADGGFLIQTDFAGQILESAVQQSPLLNRLDRQTCSSAANAMRWLSVDETDVSKSVFGGVQMYWASEAGTVAASRPQFREMKMDLEKMMGFAYATDEMLTDAAFMTGFFGSAFTLAADRLLTESVISGDGVGKPLGLLHSKALLAVDKESSQAAGTFTGANAIKMQARAMPRHRDRLAWLMHPDVEEQLPYLAIQSGEAAKFLWNPEGGLGNFDTQRVLNKPVLFEDSCSALGSKGDILLVDPYMYILLTKGTAKQDWSIHVEFLTDQNCFRMVFRCNGAPKVSKPLTIKNSTKTRSPFVALADRKYGGASMKRIFEKLAFANVFAPQSVEASTEKTTGYVDASGTEEVAFLISAAALGKGKSLTVTLMAADDASGSGAKAVGEAAVFTDPVGTEPQVVAVSYQVSPLNGRYVAVKLQHDAAAAVVCGVLAAADGMYLPPANGMTLVV